MYHHAPLVIHFCTFLLFHAYGFHVFITSHLTDTFQLNFPSSQCFPREWLPQLMSILDRDLKTRLERNHNNKTTTLSFHVQIHVSIQRYTTQRMSLLSLLKPNHAKQNFVYFVQAIGSQSYVYCFVLEI
jgi:hypothetical protein